MAVLSMKEVFMRENTRIIKPMVKESKSKIMGSSMKVIGKMGKKMERESLYGKMEGNFEENLSMIRNMEKASFFGRMEESKKDSG